MTRTRPIREQAADLCSALASWFASPTGCVVSMPLRPWPWRAVQLALDAAMDVSDEQAALQDWWPAEDIWAEAECRLREPEGRR